MESSFVCRECGKSFKLSPPVLAKFPNWVPQTCLACRKRGQPADSGMSRQDVLARFESGPLSGIFTDGFCEPNPGSGGWGAVKVINNAILAETHGGEQFTTNNRMELKALIEGYKLLGVGENLPIYTDSQLCVNIVKSWAASWQKNGWTRGKKREEIKNLDLVREVYESAQGRPLAEIQWIKGHAGHRWNEYADSLSRAHLEIGQL